MKQTELSTVNALLAIIEESPVQTVNLAHPDIPLTLQIWEEQATAFQTVSWWFNAETYQLTPDVRTGEVFVPANCVSMDLPGTEYTQLGRRLYNKEEHTYDFTGVEAADLLVQCLIERSMEELPASVYRVILIASKMVMVAHRDQDKLKLSALDTEYKMAFARVQQENLNYYGTNALNSTQYSSFATAQPVRT